MRDSKKVILAIIITGLAVYFNSFFNAFVFDDIGLIVQNPSVHSLSRLPDLLLNHNSSQLVSHYYRPISQILYALIYAVFKDVPFWYRLVQVSLHITNASLVYLFFKKHLRHDIAVLISLVFLTHPINQFTVAYISSLHDTLYLFFGLLSLFVLSNPVLTGVFLLLSLLSKESGIQFLVISSSYLFLFNRKLLPRHFMVLLITGFTYFFFRVISQTPISKDPLVPIMTLSLYQRLTHIPAIAFYYFKTFLFPHQLLAFHSWVISAPGIRNYIVPVIFNLAIIGILVKFISTTRKLEKALGLFFFYWLAIGMGIHLQIIPIDMTVSDHFFYSAQLGLLGLFGLMLTRVKFSLTIPAAILIAVLSLTTVNRNSDWKNQSRLLAHDHAISQPDYLMDLLYAGDLLGQNKYDQALIHTKTAISLYPQSGRAYNVLGSIYYQQGETEKARAAFTKSIALNNYYASYENLGLLMTKHDPPASALAFLTQATKKFPKSDKLWFYRIIVETRMNYHDQAIKSAQNYYLLKGDEVSQVIYSRLLQSLPVNIELK